VTNRIEITQGAGEEIEELVDRFGLPERCIIPLIDSFLGFKLRNMYYREANEVSDQVATNDLTRLAKLGLLEPHGARRTRFYDRGPLINAIRERVWTKPNIPDPFLQPEEAEAFSSRGLVRQPPQPVEQVQLTLPRG
jgi:hypothetical protein